MARPSTSERGKSERAQTGPVQTAPVHAGPAQTGPVLAGPAQAGPGQAGPGRSGRGDPPLWVVSYPDLQPYRPLWDLQKDLWRERWERRIPDTLLLLEHRPVVTLGKNARRENVLLSERLLRARGVDLVEVDRGGDVTYHGPGQLVGYWIFDLRLLREDAHWFLRSIEEVLIRTLASFGLEAGRDPKATGVWSGGRKVAAMGLHLSHWVSTHGFALNLTTDLTPFSWIVPCGLHGREATSVCALLGACATRAEFEAEIVRRVAEIFARDPLPLTPGELADVLLANRRRRGGEDHLAGTRENRSMSCRG